MIVLGGREGGTVSVTNIAAGLAPGWRNSLVTGSSPPPLCLSSLNLDLGQEHCEEVAGEGVQL